MAAALLFNHSTAAMLGVGRSQLTRSAPQPTLAQLPAPALLSRQRPAEAGALHSKPFLSGATENTSNSGFLLGPLCPAEQRLLEL